MNLSRCILAGLNFTSICVILCFLVPRRMGASRSRTHSNCGRTYPNGNDGVRYEQTQWHHLAEDEDFGSSSEALEDYMRNKTQTHCTCGPTLFQKKFCSSDFVIVAKKASEPQRFHADPNWKDFNYAGLAVPLVVQQVLRGSIEPNSIMAVHFIQGSTCGVPRNKIPDDDKSYIITGFQRAFFRNDKRMKHTETKKIYLVTKCGSSEPLQSLSITQITGAFLGFYCSRLSCPETEVYFEGSTPNLSQRSRMCFYPFKARKCYSKYTICSKYFARADMCSSKAVNRLSASPHTLERIPPELHDRVKEALTSQVSDEQRFHACLMQLGPV